MQSSQNLHQLANFPLCLAPMVGLSHVALRQVTRAYLPANAKTIWPTEMLNSRRLPYEDLAATPEVMRAANEDGLVPQILGNEERAIAISVQRLKEWGASGIDINMGCPVEKALKHNYGVALMGDSNYAAEVVRMTVRNTELPVSVKLRAISSQGSAPGPRSDSQLLDFVGGLQEAGAAWVTLHPRTAEQKRRGSADWEQIAHLKKHLKIPVIGNGDIQVVEDVLSMREQTGCDLVMAGRALAARPWMLWQLGEKLGFAPPVGMSGPAPKTAQEEGAEYGKVLLHLLSEMLHYFGENLALRKFRFYLRTTSVWLPFGHTLHARVTKAKNSEETRQVLVDFFAGEVEMSERTELRQ